MRRIGIEIGLTQIETHLLVKIISDAKGPNKTKLE